MTLRCLYYCLRIYYVGYSYNYFGVVYYVGYIYNYLCVVYYWV